MIDLDVGVPVIVTAKGDAHLAKVRDQHQARVRTQSFKKHRDHRYFGGEYVLAELDRQSFVSQLARSVYDSWQRKPTLFPERHFTMSISSKTSVCR